MKYQLVLQLPASSLKDYDEMIEFEATIIKHLGGVGVVDAHDMGSGETNIFILTDEPKLSFERIEAFLGTKDFMVNLKAAFREIGVNNFTILHPPNLKHFTVA